MRSTAGTSILPISVNDNLNLSVCRKFHQPAVRGVEKTDWDRVIVKADKLISGIGAVAIVLSVIYFAPVVVSIFR